MDNKLFVNFPFACFVIAKLNGFAAVLAIFSHCLLAAKILMISAACFLTASMVFCFWDMYRQRKNDQQEFIKNLIKTGQLDSYIKTLNQP